MKNFNEEAVYLLWEDEEKNVCTYIQEYRICVCGSIIKYYIL